MYFIINFHIYNDLYNHITHTCVHVWGFWGPK